ncbi:ATP-binding protein [Streptacidiphilus jiangxiensis]|uniref:Anti-sigma regulatory factor (Ser/Thr protein kinase) n=1 Tax=Streptacidiphilus jiangxiensis TaxID=235985 RepID=A0A1H8B1B9_STRJI|nr:ATP-binding protein [Streptacidiphilus jiangxiensis]SEM76762.1 hypothetical protein SAMN05414137_15515 [Streptacidiphilus jiangxiensis]
MPPTKDVPGLVDEHGLGCLTRSRRIRFKAHDQPPAVARQAVRSVFGRRMPELVGDVELVTNELVTNADTHGGGLAGLVLRLYERGAAVVVEDRSGSVEKIMDNLSAESDAEEQRVDALQLAEGGRGLFLVDAYAAGWGVETAPSQDCSGVSVVAVFALGAAS